MQFISPGDIVLRALFVFLVVMLFASVYLFLIKAVNLSCRAHCARKFRCDLANACSLQQVQKLIDRQTTIQPFSRALHRIMVEKRVSDARAAKYGNAGAAHDITAQRLIAQEAAEQAADLRQGLDVLAAMVWVAPLIGLVATVWHAGRSSLRVEGAVNDLWTDGLAMMQLGLVVAIIALLAYLSLRVANRMYLSQFDPFRRMVVSILEQGGNTNVCEAAPQRGFPRIPRRGLDFKIGVAGLRH
jgi:biopolymer transport protein ExbB/TolQ